MDIETKEIKLSTLEHTWIFDLDGTMVVHNGYKDGQDELLPGVKEFMRTIPENDYILILTARPSEERIGTEDFLQKNGIHYDKIIFDIPFGERILINDRKPSGLLCAHAISPDRNYGMEGLHIKIDETL